MFGKKSREYSTEEWEPVVRSSICTGEKVAGFKNRHTGVFEDVMLIRAASDLEEFRKRYDIGEEIKIPTIY
ncbi:MAG: aspartate dehydrogenase [Clostridiales bacterium]|nr:aspartate dehydrogenase [Clostridiales bacterium]